MVGEQQELNLEQLISWLGYAEDPIIEQVLARFICSRNQEVEEFLHASAIAYERSSSARAYLLTTENKDIAGYFTLSIGLADISKSEGLSKEDKKRFTMNKCPDKGKRKSQLYPPLPEPK
ncbi:MAG: hypothetical protein RBR15_12015 [Sphaerochaeta sp.]|nr:hypothetical protein [Sphaerochaeta sp.]